MGFGKQCTSAFIKNGRIKFWDYGHKWCILVFFDCCNLMRQCHATNCQSQKHCKVNFNCLRAWQIKALALIGFGLLGEFKGLRRKKIDWSEVFGLMLVWWHQAAFGGFWAIKADRLWWCFVDEHWKDEAIFVSIFLQRLMTYANWWNRSFLA